MSIMLIQVNTLRNSWFCVVYCGHNICQSYLSVFPLISFFQYHWSSNWNAYSIQRYNWRFGSFNISQFKWYSGKR